MLSPDQFLSTTCNQIKAKKCETLVLHQVLRFKDVVRSFPSD
jgi:hypothetical protein